ncbi:hypothetical protein D0869_04269 [Hortaea werneckii]|uniref:Small-subunit processome Utp12 domain-containing protein n=1 Tax=Hortaea werneckii TaxID=91943 RepID=A0A3M6X299_HORWE|nr:hypothetical protein D0868_15896 [Hortaea werneckii]RMX84841.1 hypothetical protein D0869_04269 [Hortaea werneckii]
MSAAKRSIRSASGAQSASSPHSSKRQKTTPNSHVPKKTGLGFLVDDDARAGRKLDARPTNGVPKNKSSRVDESHALVAPDAAEDDKDPDVNGEPQEVIDISSGEESSSDDEEVEDQARGKGGLVNGHKGSLQDAELGAADDRMEGVEGTTGTNPDEVEEEQGEASFGDMLRARHPDTIDVQASFGAPAERSALVPANENRAIAAPSATSLGTVLTQALKTNDKDLLESCFQVTELASIRSTIQRLQSHQASVLLQRLAERIHKRPGRTSNLMVWVQWTLVTHGGYLATLPEVMKRIRSLSQVVRERASGLQPLLHLKGKLDLLSAQLELRRNMQGAARRRADDEDDEDAVLYIEGQDDDWSDDDDDVEMEDSADRRLLKSSGSKRKALTGTPKSMATEADDESDEGMPNGVAQESDEESENEDGGDGQGMFDDEAEETSDDDAEEASSADEEQSEQESEDETEPSDDESEPEIKQPQPKTLNRKR